MPLIKNNAIVDDDPWVFVGDEDELPDGPVVVGLARWERDRESLVGRNAPLAIKLETLEEPARIADDLDKFEMIALEFPTYRNGRAYSYARSLRQRYGYTGEVRAIGNVLRDQLFFMARCGFDAFDADPRVTLEIFREALGDFSEVYQPSADARASVLAKRHGLSPIAARAAE